MTTQLEQAWEIAKQRYAAVGVDVEEALRQLDRLPVSMHCWQGDDVAGFENPAGSLTGGIQATGNYPGKARNAEELRADLEQALSLIPGPKRLNLHAIYLESDAPVARNEIKPEHFKNWVTWAKANKLGLDFNPSCFSHPLSADGFTLSHANDEIRQFWIDHCKASRRVSAYFGEQLGTPSVVNTPVPQASQQPQQENNFIVFGATNTPALQLTATPNIEITPTPAPQAPAVTTYKTLRKGDRGKSVISMQEALIKLGYLKGASDGNFGTGTKTAVENFQKENGLDVDGIAGAKTLEKLYTVSGVTPIPDVTVAPGDILDLPG